MNSNTPNSYVRRCGLLLTNSTGTALDLSQFRITFHIEAADVEHPNTAVIRVHNLSRDTMKRITGEYQLVVLQAGYADPNPYGVIFKGNIKQFRIGKSDALTTYLDILAADGDILYNNSFLNQTLASGHTPIDEINASVSAFQKTIRQYNSNLPTPSLNTPVAALPGGIIPAPRGKVMFGMARSTMRAAAARMQCSWSIQNGLVQVVPFTSYVQTNSIPLLSQFTGVIGIPEVTDEGIKIKTLLNPAIAVGGLVQIDNNLINLELINNRFVPYNQYKGIQLFATTDNDGYYRVYVVEHDGDTRGQQWYTNLVCLAFNRATNQVIRQAD